MGGVDRLVAEDAVDGEVARGRGAAIRALLRGELVEERGGDGGGVRAQDQAQRLVGGPGVSVSDRAVLAVLVHLLDVVPVRLGVLALLLGTGPVGDLGVGDVEGVLQVAGRVLLGHEEGVEVPEAGLDELVGGHLLEAHLEEDLAEFLADLVEGVQGTGVLVGAEGLEVVWLEVGRLPGARGDHVGGQVGLFFLDREGKLGSLFGLEANNLLHLDELALLEVGKSLGIAGSGLLDLLELCLSNVLDRVGLQWRNKSVSSS